MKMFDTQAAHETYYMVEVNWLCSSQIKPKQSKMSGVKTLLKNIRTKATTNTHVKQI